MRHRLFATSGWVGPLARWRDTGLGPLGLVKSLSRAAGRASCACVPLCLVSSVSLFVVCHVRHCTGAAIEWVVYFKVWLAASSVLAPSRHAIRYFSKCQSGQDFYLKNDREMRLSCSLFRMILKPCLMQVSLNSLLALAAFLFWAEVLGRQKPQVPFQNDIKIGCGPRVPEKEKERERERASRIL